MVARGKALLQYLVEQGGASRLACEVPSLLEEYPTEFSKRAIQVILQEKNTRKLYSPCELPYTREPG